MCITPTMLPNGTEVGCRQCWQCHALKINSLVGRCIAESKYSAAVTTMTLTYGKQSGANAVTIVYADVQQFLKNLRKKYKVRFICASEYGTKRGRAHHHIVLFWGNRIDGKKGKGYEYPDWDNEYKEFVKNWPKDKHMPEIYKKGNCFNYGPWTHGHVYIEHGIAHEKFAYAMKYTFKDMEQRSTKNELRMSLKPILGHEYFDALAQEYVDNRLKPKAYKYRFKDFKDKYGNIRTYYMSKTLKQRFKEMVRQKWQEKWNEQLQCELFDYNSNEIEVKPRLPCETIWITKIPKELEYISNIDKKRSKYFVPWKFDQTDVVRAKYQGIDIEITTDKKGTTVTYNSKEGKQEWHDVPDAVKEKLIEKAEVEQRLRYQQREEA